MRARTGSWLRYCSIITSPSALPPHPTHASPRAGTAAGARRGLGSREGTEQAARHGMGGALAGAGGYRDMASMPMTRWQPILQAPSASLSAACRSRRNVATGSRPSRRRRIAAAGETAAARLACGRLRQERPERSSREPAPPPCRRGPGRRRG